MAREFIEKQDTLNDGREKLNRSITRAYDADEKSDEAIKTSNEAKQTSEEANDKSDYTQVQLDTVTGASTIDPAVEQLKVGSDGQTYPSPDARIRTEHEKVTAQLAETVNQIDEKISSLNGLEIKGAFDTVQDLKAGYPNGTNGLYVVHADNYWYYWNGEQWTKGNLLATTPWAEYMTTQNEEWVI